MTDLMAPNPYPRCPTRDVVTRDGLELHKMERACMTSDVILSSTMVEIIAEASAPCVRMLADGFRLNRSMALQFLACNRRCTHYKFKQELSFKTLEGCLFSME